MRVATEEVKGLWNGACCAMPGWGVPPCLVSPAITFPMHDISLSVSMHNLTPLISLLFATLAQLALHILGVLLLLGPATLCCGSACALHLHAQHADVDVFFYLVSQMFHCHCFAV